MLYDYWLIGGNDLHFIFVPSILGRLMSYYLLIFEIILDVTALVLGIILICRERDNHLRMIWGFMTGFLALFMLNDNFHWLFLAENNWGELPVYLLSLLRMLKWYALAHIFSLFPLASLRPGWLTSLRLIIFCFPLLIVGVIALCYIWFNGHITPIHSVRGIFFHIGKLDVQLRLAVFFISLVNPLLYLAIPFMGKWAVARRRLTSRMYLYLICGTVSCLMYVFFTLKTSSWVFDLYGYVVIAPSIIFSLMYLRDEDPLSSPFSSNEKVPNDGTLAGQPVVSLAVYKLFLQMEEFMKKEKPFVVSDYSIHDLTASLDSRQSLVIRAIQYAGFSGFREYVSFLRLNYFKQLAMDSPYFSVKELMFRSGFSSRSSFYRYFTEQEKMSPKEFIDRLSAPV